MFEYVRKRVLKSISRSYTAKSPLFISCNMATSRTFEERTLAPSNVGPVFVLRWLEKRPIQPLLKYVLGRMAVTIGRVSDVNVFLDSDLIYEMYECMAKYFKQIFLMLPRFLTLLYVRL
jgi:hypothetical protein